MPDFYALSDEQKETRFLTLVNAALPHWGLQGAHAELIKQRENAVFALQLPGGDRAVMRVHRAGYHSDDELRSELEWMGALDRFGVPTPAVLPATDGAQFKVVSVPQVPEPRQVDVLAWVEGAASGAIEQGLEEAAAARDNYRMIGGLLAKMHAFSRQWALPAGFTRHAWDLEGLLGDEPWWGRFWELALLDDGQRQRLAAASERARVELLDYGTGPDRYGLIHADPLPENFLVDADGTVRVIDFDDGGFGWYLFDFATALFFLLGEEPFDDMLAALVEGYQEEQPLPPEFGERLPLFFLLRGFTYLGWVHTRSETETAKALGPVAVAGVMALVDEYLGKE